MQFEHLTYLQTCQMLVEIQPCDGLSLYMLGSAQLTLAEGDPDSEEGKRLIEEAKESFKASISLEGKPASGDPPPQITGKSKDTLISVFLQLELN